MKSPAFVSRPHFYLADPSYLSQFQYGVAFCILYSELYPSLCAGQVRPDPGRHRSEFLLEPLTSIPVRVQVLTSIACQCVTMASTLINIFIGTYIMVTSYTTLLYYMCNLLFNSDTAAAECAA